MKAKWEIWLKNVKQLPYWVANSDWVNMNFHTLRIFGLTWMVAGLSGGFEVIGHAGSTCPTRTSRAYNLWLLNNVDHVCLSLNMDCLVFLSTWNDKSFIECSLTASWNQRKWNYNDISITHQPASLQTDPEHKAALKLCPIKCHKILI